MTDLLTIYLATVLAAYVVQQGATWMSMLSWVRVLKAAGWPAILLRPLVSSMQERHEEMLKRKKP
jgi:uncharacterized membrane protein YpjA